MKENKLPVKLHFLSLVILRSTADSPTVYTAKVSCAVSNFLAMFAKMLDVAVYIGFIGVAKRMKNTLSHKQSHVQSLNPKLDRHWFSHHFKVAQ